MMPMFVSRSPAQMAWGRVYRFVCTKRSGQKTCRKCWWRGAVVRRWPCRCHMSKLEIATRRGRHDRAPSHRRVHRRMALHRPRSLRRAHRADVRVDFGDGTRATLSDPQVTHSYRFRPQDKRYSSFLVSLTIPDARARRTTAPSSRAKPAIILVLATSIATTSLRAPLSALARQYIGACARYCINSSVQ